MFRFICADSSHLTARLGIGCLLVGSRRGSRAGVAIHRRGGDVCGRGAFESQAAQVKGQNPFVADVGDENEEPLEPIK